MRFKILLSSLILMGFSLFSGMSPEGQIRKSSETPPHGAPLPGGIYSVDPIVGNLRYVPFPGRHFAAMETKVTQGMWAAFAAAEPTFATDPIWDSGASRGPGIALECVSWNYAVVFANLLSKLNGFTPCYYTDGSKSVPIDARHFVGDFGIDSQLSLIYCDFSANGYRLPRDAEWTYFCQGGYNVGNLVEYATQYDPVFDRYYQELLEEWVWDAWAYGLGAVEPSVSKYGIVKTGLSCAEMINDDAMERWWNITSFAVRLVRTVSPEVTSLTSKFAEPAYYLKGPSFKVTHTAVVDWMGHSPGLVRFITSKGQTDVVVDMANPTTASCAIDMGAEIDPCAPVKAVAIGLDGARSPEKKNGSVVYPPPAPLDKMSFTPYDGGSSFLDLGIVLRSGDPANCEARNGYFAGGQGDFSVIPDRDGNYFYFLFGNYGGDPSTHGVAVARLAAEDLLFQSGAVWKYYRGEWSEHGLDGRVTPVFPAAAGWDGPNTDAFWGPSVHWNTAVRQYVIFLNRACCSPGWPQEGIYISMTPDLAEPSSWAHPARLLDAEDWYPSLHGAAPGETSSEAGARGRLYVRGASAWEVVFHPAFAESRR